MKKAFRRWCALLLSVAMLFTMDGTIYAAETAGTYTAQAVADGGDAQQVTVAEMAESAEVKSVAETTESIEASSTAETAESVEASSAAETAESVEASSAAETAESVEASSAAETAESVEASSAAETAESVEASSVVETTESAAEAESAEIIEAGNIEEASDSAKFAQYNDFTYETINSTIKITGYTGSETTLDIPAQIGGLDVTAIGDAAFAGKTAITTVTIPSTVTTIGNGAFRNCTGLTDLTINAVALGEAYANSTESSYDASLSIFYNAGSSAGFTVTFGTGITTIPAYLFATGHEKDNGVYCKVSKVVISDTVKTIDKYAFYHCYKLKEIEGGSGVTSLENYAFCYTGFQAYVQFPALTKIGTAAYMGCEDLETVEVTGVVESIGNYAFRWCTKLRTVTVAGAVTSIGEYAFANNTALQNVTISDPVATLGQYAFYNDTALSKATLPSTLKRIGVCAFKNCTGLTDLTINAKELEDASENSIDYNEYSGSSANSIFYNAGSTDGFTITFGDEVTKIPAYLFATYENNSNCNVSKVVLGEKVQTIEPYAFYACKRLSEIEGGSAVTAIGKYTFAYSGLTAYVQFPALTEIPEAAYYECDSLETVAVTGAVTSIGTNAFRGCSKLRTVTVGGAVTTIGEYAFAGDTALQNLTIFDPVVTLGQYAFYNDTALSKATLPSTLKRIGVCAFKDCTGLTEMTINAKELEDASENSINYNEYSGSSVHSIFYNAGSTDGFTITFGDEVTKIPAYLFATYENNSNCNVSKVVLGEKVQTIEPYAFYACKRLSEIEGGSAVTAIGKYTFAYSGLTAYVQFPALTEISEAAYYECDSLETVAVTGAVTSIGTNAFRGCSKLRTVTVAGAVTSIGEYAFAGDTALQNVTISDPVATLGQYAFYNDTALSKVTLSSTLKRIGACAFKECTGLTEMTINAKELEDASEYSINDGNSYNSSSSASNSIFYNAGSTDGFTIIFGDEVTKIPAYLFATYNNSGTSNHCNVSKVILGAKVQTIEPYTFYACKRLSEIEGGSGVTNVGACAFAYTSLKAAPQMPALITLGASAYSNCTVLETAAIGDAVTSIGANAFEACTALKTVTIGKAVTSIGTYAFKDCTGLTDMTINARELEDAVVYNEWGSATAIAMFYNTGSDNGFTVTFGEEVVKIPAYLFRYSNVSKAILGDNVATIGNYAFGGCTKLQKIEGGKSVTSLGEEAFRGTGLTECGNFPLLTSIPEGAYYGCKLTTVELTAPVTSIGDYAFCECTALKTVNIGDTVTSIGEYAFSACTLLESVKIGNAVTDIGEWSFGTCPALKTVSIGNAVTGIEAHAFSGDKALENLTIPDAVTTLGDYVFEDCSGLSKVTLSSNLSSIGRCAFKNCTGLTEMTINGKKLEDAQAGSANYDDYEYEYYDGNSSIFYNAGSSSGFTVTFGENVRRIPAYLFATGSSKSKGVYCKVSKVYIQGNVTDIGDYAFANCYDLKEVYFSGSIPFTVGEHSFYNVTANMNYPEKNRSYTDETRLNYGGSLTWVPVPGEEVFVESISLEQTTLTLEAGDKFILDVNVLPLNASNRTVLWSVSDANVASVGRDGEVTALHAGTATITATTEDGGKTASCVLTVTPAPLKGIEFETDRISIVTGESRLLPLNTLPVDAENTTVSVNITSQTPSSGAETVIRLENTAEGWKVIGVAEGTARVEASATDGKNTYTATCWITVTYVQSDPGNNDDYGEQKEGLWIAGISGEGYSYTGAAIKPEVRVYYGSTMLRPGNEYRISYKKNKAVGTAQIIVNGKGAYGGKHTENFKIVACDLSTENALVSVTAVKTDKGLATTVTVAGKAIKPAKDFTIKDNGDGTATVTGNGNYTGSRTVAITETAPEAIKNTVITLPKSVEYTGGPIVLTEQELKVSTKEGTLLDKGTHYKVSYQSNQNVGTATVYITGLIDSTGKGYSGTVKKTLKITPAQFDDRNTTISVASYAEYEKGGAKLSPEITWTCARTGKIWTLREGVDYSVSYSQNTKPGRANMTIKGIGCFKGSRLADYTFTVTEKSIGECYGYCADKKYNPKKKGSYYMSAPVIYDTNGKKLALNKDYTVKYYNTSTYDMLEKDTTVRLGNRIRATVTGINGYAGSTKYIYYYVESNVKDIGKAKVSKIAPQEYTGSAINLKETNAFPTVTMGKDGTLTEGYYGYEVVRYFNNVKKGTASVLIEGTGQYSGSKMITFKIVPRKWK